MANLRAFLCDQRHFAALLLALALCTKVLVPPGYMVGQEARVLSIEICADASGSQLTKQIVVPHAGEPKKAGHGDGKSSAACPYAGLSMPALTGADPLLLALALAFILALCFARLRTAPPPRILHLRPPLRGPPALT